MARGGKSKNSKEASSGSPGLLSLPDDVLVNILEQLNIKDRLRVSMVSKRLLDVVGKPSALWRSLVFSVDVAAASAVTKAEWFLAWISNKASAVEELAIRLKDSSEEEDITPAVNANRAWLYLLGALQACRGTLQSLELDWVGSLALGPWLRGLSSLTELKVGSTKEVRLEPGLERLASLQSLHIISTPYTKIASLPVSLMRFCLYGDESEFDSSNGLRLLSALKVLDIHDTSLADSALASLPALSRLTMLSLDKCGLRAVPPQLAALTTLRKLYFDRAQVSGQQLEVLGALKFLEVVSFVIAT